MWYNPSMLGYPLDEMIRAAGVLVPRVLAQMRHRAMGVYAAPFKIKFFVTYRCNLPCVHCNLHSSKPREDELTTQEYQTIFSKNPDFFFVSFSGGEPTLRDDLPELIQMAARSARGSTVISVNMNGFVTKRSVDAMRAALDGLDGRARLIAAVSSDGPETTHNQMRGHPEAYARAERTIDALKGIQNPQFEVRRNICISPFNLDEIPDFLSRLVSTKERHHVCFYQYGSHYDHTERHREAYAEFRRRIPELIKQIQQAEQASDLLGKIYLDLIGEFYSKEKPASVLPCYSSYASVIVDPSGAVLPCINFHHELGNLRDYDFSLEPLLTNDPSQKTKGQIRKGLCPGCWTPNEAYATILCNLFNPTWLPTWLRARFR